MNSTLAQVDFNASAVEAPESPTSVSRWTQVLSHLDPKYGGLSAAVPSLSSHLRRTQQFDIQIAAFCSPDESGRVNHHPELTITRWPADRKVWLSSNARHIGFRNTLSPSHGIHIHGLWEASTAVAAKVSRELHKPYVISAHGMLEPWALANKGWKKRLYVALIERANLDGAACLHALTSSEAEDYRRLGLKRPIAVIPNGVNAPEKVSSNPFLDRFPQLAGKRILLFLGRIHPKKGIDLLVRAWTRLERSFPEAILVLAGPDSENSRSAVEALIVERDLTHRVFFTGMLEERLKWSALAAAHCFVLPSYSEGLSIAVLEALSVGVPVVITTQCHLPEVRAHNAGWQIPAAESDLTHALREALEMYPADRKRIGDCGRKLVQQRFSWPVVADQMAELYRWVTDNIQPRSFELLEPRS